MTFIYMFTVIGRTDAEAKIPILLPPNVKNWLIWKDPDARKDWRWKQKGMTEDEMVGQHHRLNGHEELLMDREAWQLQSIHKVSDTSEWLNWTEEIIIPLGYLCSLFLRYFRKFLIKEILHLNQVTEVPFRPYKGTCWCLFFYSASLTNILQSILFWYVTDSFYHKHIPKISLNLKTGTRWRF